MHDWEASYLAGIIDGEGSITLSKLHTKENRRPCISIASTDIELLWYIQSLAGGKINSKRNYKPAKHKDSFTLTIIKKEEVFSTLRFIFPFLRIEKKKLRAKWILDHYESVTILNGKYTAEQLLIKTNFENEFFNI